MEKKDSNLNNQRQQQSNYYSNYGNLPMGMSMPGANPYNQPYYQQMMFQNSFIPTYSSNANAQYSQYQPNLNFGNPPIMPPTMPVYSNYQTPTNYFHGSYQIPQNSGIPQYNHPSYQFPRYLPPPQVYKMYYEKIKMDLNQKKPQESLRYGSSQQKQMSQASLFQKERFYQDERINFANNFSKQNFSNQKQQVERKPRFQERIEGLLEGQQKSKIQNSYKYNQYEKYNPYGKNNPFEKNNPNENNNPYEKNNPYGKNNSYDKNYSYGKYNQYGQQLYMRNNSEAGNEKKIVQNSFRYQKQQKDKQQKNNKKVAELIILDSDQQISQQKKEDKGNLNNKQQINMNRFKFHQQNQDIQSFSNRYADQNSQQKNAEQKKKPLQKFLQENNNNTYWKIEKQVRDRKTIKQQKKLRKQIERQRLRQKIYQKDYKNCMKQQKKQENFDQGHKAQQLIVNNGGKQTNENQFYKKKKQLSQFKQIWHKLKINRQLQVHQQKQKQRKISQNIQEQEEVGQIINQIDEKQQKNMQRKMVQVANLKASLQKELDKTRKKGQNLVKLKLQIEKHIKILVKYHEQKGKIQFVQQKKQKAFKILQEKFRLYNFNSYKFSFSFQQAIQFFQMLYKKYSQLFKTKNPFDFDFDVKKKGDNNQTNKKSVIQQPLHQNNKVSENCQFSKKIQSKLNSINDSNIQGKIANQYYEIKNKSKQAIKRQQYFIEKLEGLHDNKMQIQRSLKIVKQQNQLAKQLKNNESHGKIRKGKQYFQWFPDQHLQNNIQKSVCSTNSNKSNQTVFLTLTQKLQFKKQGLLQRKIDLLSF